MSQADWAIVSHSIVTNNSACKTLQAQSEQLNRSTDEENQEAELKLISAQKHERPQEAKQTAWEEGSETGR